MTHNSVHAHAQRDFPFTRNRKDGMVEEELKLHSIYRESKLLPPSLLSIANTYPIHHTTSPKFLNPHSMPL